MENKNIIIAVVLGALVLIALFQAFQLVGLKDKLGSGTSTATSNAPAPQASAGGSPSLPSNLQNLPSMVGGC